MQKRKLRAWGIQALGALLLVGGVEVLFYFYGVAPGDGTATAYQLFLALLCYLDLPILACVAGYRKMGGGPYRLRRHRGPASLLPGNFHCAAVRHRPTVFRLAYGGVGSAGDSDPPDPGSRGPGVVPPAEGPWNVLSRRTLTERSRCCDHF